MLLREAMNSSAYSNRTAVLLPRSTALTPSSLPAALQARRVYATMDKHRQLIFAANGHMMGERMQNRGKLTLRAQYASTTGHSTAAISIFHGIPGRKGTVTTLGTRAKRIVTPLPGEHFYYARVTQDDGKCCGVRPSGSRSWPADTLSIVRNGNFNYSNIFLARKAGSIVTKTIK